MEKRSPEEIARLEQMIVPISAQAATAADLSQQVKALALHWECTLVRVQQELEELHLLAGTEDCVL